MAINNNPGKFCETATRILGGLEELSYSEQIKRTLGNTLGQTAFSKITGSIPRIHVANNVNSGVRRLIDAVNTGNVSIAGKTANWATRQVLGAAGIDSGVVPPDPNGKTIYDSGMTAAKTIGGAIIEGTIDHLHLPPQISGLSALAFLQQQQGQMAHDITDPQCGISAYARDLIKYAPKHNFMFMVQVTFQPDYTSVGMQENTQISKDEEVKFHFLCKSITRPPIETEYEDVNMYNFRTKVAKKVIQHPLTMKLYDDNKNSTMAFVEKYLKVRSPIARKTPAELDLYETRGMDFTPYQFNDKQKQKMEPSSIEQYNNSSATLGGLINENRSILRRIDIYHIFNYGSKVNQYTYMNPKIITLDMNDLDMDDGTTAATVDITVNYDSMFMYTDVPMETPDVREKSQLGEKYMKKFSQ